MAQVHNLQMQGVTKPEISSRNETEGKKEGSSVNLTNNRDILRGELSNKLLPILNLMKFSGEFYGDTSLSETPPATSNFISRIYCGMVLLGQITILAQAVASLVYEGFDEMKNTYTLLLFGVWYLQSVGLLKSDNSRERDTIFFFTFLYWWMGLSSQIAVIFMFGIRVHEKIHGIYDALQQIVVADCKEHLELLHFLMHLRGEPIGMSVGGLVVINKSLLLSVVGIIISYLAVLLTLPA
ncbi:hypothetical protein AWC38_SpisGene6471 [Stylophora pistillata]|uniref:Uncharacterized protein n=1 Tax=Stylophora pistillata TaxID=50429 RepID=A0A2B4SFZ8_STYPI|nr:hypothetical protein AWC38_SpisGene6471 [Stylophora pistillata]